MERSLRMAIIRTIGTPISAGFYNSQEIGLARGLSKCNISVDVYVAGAGTQVKCQDIEADGSGKVRLFEVPFRIIPAIHQAVYPKLIPLLKRGSYQFIHVNEENELTSFQVARYARLRGIPVVVYQGMYEGLTGRIYSTFQRCYDLLLLPKLKKYIDMAFVKTSRAGTYLQKKGFDKTMILPVGLDLAYFAQSRDRDWRNEFHIPKQSAIILYVGIFEKRRNIDFMIDLAVKLRDDDVVFVMAGAGPEHSRIATRIESENIDNVRLVGMVEQGYLPGLYRESSLFLLPSSYEIYGMVVLEAMYFGVPVMSTCTAGPEDIIVDGIDGFLMSDLDCETWVAGIRNAVKERDILAEMSKMAAEKISRNLCWDAIALTYNGHIRGLIKSRDSAIAPSMSL